MTNKSLGEDYIKRAHGRWLAIEALFKGEFYADVVRECQEACELALKGLIRKAGHVVPFNHDVSQKLMEIKGDLSPKIQKVLPRLCEISKNLRRDRELAFYGSEDITPGEFYQKTDAKRSMDELKEVLAAVGKP